MQIPTARTVVGFNEDVVESWTYVDMGNSEDDVVVGVMVVIGKRVRCKRNGRVRGGERRIAWKVEDEDWKIYCIAS